MGPKFCLYKHCDEEEYLNNLEQAILKYKWDRMGDAPDDESEEEYKGGDTEEEKKEEEKVQELAKEQEARSRSVFDRDDMTWDYSRR